MQHERSQLLNDKDTIQQDYEELLRTFNQLKDDHVSVLGRRRSLRADTLHLSQEEALAGLAKAEAREAEATSALSASKGSQSDRTSKIEVERLRAELRVRANCSCGRPS